MKLLSYNIRFGGENRGPLIASVIRECDPDIVILQEATNPDVVKQIAADVGMPHWASRHGHSLGFISRKDIAHYEWIQPEGVRHSFLEIRPAGIDVTIFGVHLRAVHSNLMERGRLRELNALLDAIKEHRDTFHLITGDFNTLAPGERLDMSRLPRKLRLLALLLGGRIRFRTIQAMLDAGYIDTYRQFHTDEGYTFPTWDPHVRLDYYFVRSPELKRVQSCQIMREIASAAGASDHFPLMAVIDV